MQRNVIYLYVINRKTTLIRKTSKFSGKNNIYSGLII